MKNSKFKKALSDEMKHEYKSFYLGSEEHIFSPEFEEEMERLLSGKKHKKRLFAVFFEKPAFKYSLSACTALALCAGVLTIWHNHIKDNISDMEDMVVPPTTQTTVSMPEATEAVSSGSKPVTTDPTEANTKVSQDKTETTVTAVSTLYAVSPPPREAAVTTALIGPPSKPPVVTRISVVTGKRPHTTAVPPVTVFPNTLPTTVSTSVYGVDPTSPTPTLPTLPSPINTTVTTGNGGRTSGQPITQPIETKVTARTTANVVLPTEPVHTLPVPNVTTRPDGPEPTPIVTVSPVPSTVPVTRNPYDPPSGASGEEIDVPETTKATTVISYVSVTSIEVSPVPSTGYNTDMPHIAFDEISWSYNGTFTYRFSNYINEWQFENYDHISSSVTYLRANNGKPEKAEVHVIKQSTGELSLAIYFMNTETYAFYIQNK